MGRLYEPRAPIRRHPVVSPMQRVSPLKMWCHAIALVGCVTLIGCGGSAVDVTTPTPPTPRDQITEVVERWAPLFARGSEKMCDYATAHLAQACAYDIYVGEPRGWQTTFAGVQIEEIEISGGNAVVTFDNEQKIELSETFDGWAISNIRQNPN